MELSLSMKIRIAIAAAVGILLLSILGWHLAEPSDVFGIVSVKGGTITVFEGIQMAVLAFAAGFLAYFAAWPYGRELGILAVPAGLAVLAFRSGSVGNIMQMNPTVPQRQEIFSAFRFEPVFWLFLVAIGFVGVLVAQRIKTPANLKAAAKPAVTKKTLINSIIAIAICAFVAKFVCKILVQDVTIFDNRLGSVIGQPSAAQIMFGVLVAFAAGSFLARMFFGVSYTWCAVATVIVPFYVFNFRLSTQILQRLADHLPAVFFSDVVSSILPVQMVAFGTIGCVVGYWASIRYDYWREHGE